MNKEVALNIYLLDRTNTTKRNNFIEAHMGVISKVIKKQFRFDAQYKEDIFNEGVLGLIDAAEKFNPQASQEGFDNYAYRWIRHNIRSFLSKQSGQTKGMSARRAWRKDNQRFSNISSLTAPNDADNDIESQLSTDEYNPSKLVEKNILIKKVRRALADIIRSSNDPKVEAIVFSRMLKDQPDSLAQVGKNIGMSGEGARLIEHRIREALRARLTDQTD